MSIDLSSGKARLVLTAAAVVLFMCISSLAHAGGPLDAEKARAEAASLIKRVSAAAGQPGGMAGWAGATAGEPLLVEGTDGKPSEYLVPVVAQGRTVSTIGVDAGTGRWSWYGAYDLPEFPLVSPAEATSKVKGWMKKRGLTTGTLGTPAARISTDKKIYWVFEPKGSTVEETSVPAFEEAEPVKGVPGDGGRISTRAKPAAAPSGGAAATSEDLSGPLPPTVELPSGGAPAAYDIAGVPYHFQQTDWWCGPASLEMVLDYFGPDINQADVAGVADQDQMYGSYADDLARAAHFSSLSTSTQDASLEGYDERDLGYGMAYEFWSMPSLFDRRYSDLKELISQNIPVLALTYYWNPPSSGHFRVVKGYNDTLGTFSVHDPWYAGPGPHGADVQFNQAQFVDTLWDYSDRWAMIACPWSVAVQKPYTVSAGQTFTVSASVAYRGPSPLNDYYPAQDATATIAAANYQIMSGSASVPVSGINATGSTGTASWTLRATATGRTDDIQVTAAGVVQGDSRAYDSYNDMIGGVGTEAPPPGPTSRSWGHDSVGVSGPANTWYLAEGCTKGGFETWVLVQNPSPTTAAHVTVSYMTAQGPVNGPTVDLAPSSRTTFNVANTVPDQWDVSTMVTSTWAPVVAERAIYANGRAVGTESVGVSEASATWYLAEGCTNGGFETWVLVQNPNTQPATVTLQYMTDAGPVAGPSAVLPANSRKTFFVADTVPGRWSVSTMVVADKPVVAERSMYGGNRAWGHDSIGTSQAATTWYLAEGCTNGGFETWVLVQNPNPQPAEVDLIYMTEAGQAPGPHATLPANSRKTFFVADSVPGQWSVSTVVTSKVPVIAERSMYGNNRTWGHDSIGVTTPAANWSLAEGCTNTGFESWVLVQNPNPGPASINITYMTPAGPVPGPTETLPGNSRKTYSIADTVPWEWEVSVSVTSTVPIIAERAMYGDSR